MPTPSLKELTSAYARIQVERVRATLERIIARPSPVSSGRLIPVSSDIAIHDGRRIEATVLFLDICKFSNRPCETEEDQLLTMRILSLFFSEMIRIVEDFGGTVEKNTGDGLMAYFATSGPQGETIQQRATACALTMFFAAENLINPIITHSKHPQLDFRICMDHGNVTIAKVGAARRFNGIVAIGTTANIASKMLSIAGPNQLLVGNAVIVGLPDSWVENWARLETSNSGWVYESSGMSYPLWTYHGRWKVPQI